MLRHFKQFLKWNKPFLFIEKLKKIDRNFMNLKHSVKMIAKRVSTEMFWLAELASKVEFSIWLFLHQLHTFIRKKSAKFLAITY